MHDTLNDLAVAKRIIKRALKRRHIPISHITTKDIIIAAREVLKHPAMIKAERYNIKRRKEPSNTAERQAET